MVVPCPSKGEEKIKKEASAISVLQNSPTVKMIDIKDHMTRGFVLYAVFRKGQALWGFTLGLVRVRQTH